MKRIIGPTAPANGRSVHAVARIALLYLAFGALWILLSDSALRHIVAGTDTFSQWSTYKGWAFVVVTAALLAFLLRREFLAREQSQANERDSEARYRQLFDANPQPMWVYDRATLRFLAVNDAAVSRYGWSREEFMAMTLADIRPKDDVPRLLESLEQSPEARFCDTGIWRHRKRDGMLIDVEVSRHTMQFDGRPAALVLAQDVTERLRAASVARESERFARSTLDSLPANIAILDENGSILAVNRAWRQFAERNGADPARVSEGANYLGICDDAVGEDSGMAHAFAAGVRDVLSGRRTTFGLEYPCHSPIEKRWFGSRVARFVGDGPLRVVVGHVDITERRKAENAFREQADRMTRYLSASPCIVYALAVVGDEYVPEFVSENVRDELGYSVAEALAPQWWLTHLHPHDRPGTLAAVKSLRDSDIVTCSYRFQRSDRTWVWLHDHQRLQRDAQGNPARIFGALTDITELREAQEALLASEQRFRSAFEQASVGMAHTTPDGRRLMVNQCFAEMLGYTRAELLALPVERVTHPDDYSADLEFVSRVLDGAAPAYSREKRFLHRNGQVVWAAVSITLVRRGDGTPDYFAGVVVDITERKRAEEALRASEQNLARAQHIAHLGSWELSLVPGDAHLYWSDEVYEIFGIAPPEFGATYEAFLAAVHPGDRARMHAAHRRARIGEELLDIEHRIVRPDGTVRWVHELGELERNAHETPTRLTGTVQDITERKQAAEALRLLSLAVEQSSESIVITDLEANIEYVNDAFSRVSGYSRDEVLGRNPRVLHSGKTAPDTYRTMWAALKDGRQWQGEFRNRRKDGSEYLESAVIMPVRETDGKVTHYVAVKEDITERRRIEEELGRHRHHLEDLVAQRTAQLAEARQQAEAANAAKSTFLANMSHEIRTPMNGVLGMVEVLAQTRVSEQQAEMIKTIRESGTALLALIDDILDFSKIEAGRMAIEPAPTSVGDVVEGLCDALVPVALRKGVDLSVFVSPEIPEPVVTDGMRLRQMLYNLLGNAIKFSGGRNNRRGRVALRVSVAERSPLRLAFAIIDDGIGMSDRTMASLFRPFEQGEISTTRQYGGTGLGLAICRRIADLMRGEITATSASDKGSTFTLTLPVEVPHEAPAPAPMLDLAGLDCIVVESASLDVDGICIYLSHAGARVRRVPDTTACEHIAACLAGPVVALCDAGLAHHSQITAAKAASNLRYLLITRGRRRRARIEASNIVSLDGAALRRRALLRAVAIAAGRASPEVVTHAAEPDERTGGSSPRLSVAEARERGQLILVAEDDEINQRVIARQLDLLGRAAEIARDGAEALRMWRNGRYALLLTDLHMPVMDGYGLTKAIRELEVERARPSLDYRRLPIIALTANALRGEAERAKASGMDDYLTKPLQLAHLRRVLERYAQPDRCVPSPVAPTAPTPAAAFDGAALKEFIGDDPTHSRELLAVFLKAARLQSAELRASCATGDAKTAALIAHKLKSSSRTVGAARLSALCAEIEQIAKDGDLAGLAQRIEPLETLVQQACSEIEQFVAEMAH